MNVWPPYTATYKYNEGNHGTSPWYSKTYHLHVHVHVLPVSLWSVSLPNADHMHDYFVNHDMIIDHHISTWLIKGLSTCTNLLECFNDWTLSLQGRRGVTIAYADLKAKPLILSRISRMINCCIAYIHTTLTAVCSLPIICKGTPK